MEEIGHYRIRGKAKSQKNWKIYADVENSRGVLHIEDYKYNGQLFFDMDSILPVHNMHGFTTFKDLSLVEFGKVLKDVEDFYRGRYRSLKWFLDLNKVNKILVVLRLKQ